MSQSVRIERYLQGRPVINVSNFEFVSAGDEHACAVTNDGKAYCWGNNSHNQIGSGKQDKRKSDPVRAVPEINMKSISAGRDHTCAISSDKQVYCWGSSYSGELGSGIHEVSHKPVKVVIK